MKWNPASFYVNDSNALACTLCAHMCSFKKDGDIGFCHTRRRKNNQLETATLTVGIQHLDTVERKPLYHYKPGKNVLTLATPGCTFQCLYCQNYRLSQFGRSEQASWRSASLKIEDIVNNAAENQAAIGFSYAEPTLNAELTLALHELAKPRNIGIIWKTNGFLTESAAKILSPTLAAANIDLKSLNERQHKKLTGANLKPVLDTIRTFYNAGVWLEISTPLIPTINSDVTSIGQIAKFIASIDTNIPWHLGRFNPDFKLQKLPPTSIDMLKQARKIGLDAGLKYVYVERALGSEGRTTYCSSCGKPLITREIWKLENNDLKDNKCPNCQTLVAGKW